MRHAVREDHATLRRYSEKYGGRDTDEKRSPEGRLVRIGFQIMVAVRLMHFFRDAGMTPLAMVASRLIRHMYGSDIHWDARFEPGVQIVHGMGLAISPKASVGKDCIIFQNVTLGESGNGAPRSAATSTSDPVRRSSDPSRSATTRKIMATCVVRENVPTARP